MELKQNSISININNYKDFSYKFNEAKTMDKNKRKVVKLFLEILSPKIQ